ncbi:MAG: dihydrolipoyl dehydrogenase [Thermoplasmatota archaeon]
MKEYDLISIGTGSAMSVVTQVLNDDPSKDIAIIENEAPGGICLTRGCIPSKMLLYPAELVNHIKDSDKFGIDVDINNVDFKQIMERMRDHIIPQSDQIGRNLKQSDDLDFFQDDAEFIDDYTLKVGNDKIKGKKIILGTGSRDQIPPIKNIDKVDYLTSKSFLDLEELPESIVIVGGGYIAAEYGYFLSMMGSDVTIVGRNPQFIPSEEKEVSDLAEDKLSQHMDIKTGYEVKMVKEESGKKLVYAKSKDGKKIKVGSDELLIAAGRRSNSDILKPKRSGIETTDGGWIKVNDYLETTKDNVWALGDATGKDMFKHVANYEAELVYYNAFTDMNRKVDYHAVPHAVFTYPEIASVGMKEDEARENHDISIGYYGYENTAKGSAMELEDYFVKVIVEQESYRILGAHIIGPQASVLIQEIINLMYTDDQSAIPIYRGMHIHPSMSEVVERAFSNLHSHEHTH